MNILQLTLKLTLIAGCVGLAYSVMMLFRNEWVYRKRCKLRGTEDYNRLPPYDVMMKRWWVWDINKFL